MQTAYSMMWTMFFALIVIAGFHYINTLHDDPAISVQAPNRDDWMCLVNHSLTMEP